MDATTKLRITAWQPYFADFMLACQDAGAPELGILGSDAELRREIFTWPLEEDIWAGVTDDTLRVSLQRRFVTDFQPERPPAERSMARYGEFVDAVGDVLAASGSEWSAASSGIADGSATTYMIDALAAFHQQASWIRDVFRDLPGASVSVR